MPLDDDRPGGGDCWRCGGFGFARERYSEAEARRVFGEDVVSRGAKFVAASASMPCPECDAGRRVAKAMGLEN